MAFVAEHEAFHLETPWPLDRPQPLAQGVGVADHLGLADHAVGLRLGVAARGIGLAGRLLEAADADEHPR